MENRREEERGSAVTEMKVIEKRRRGGVGCPCFTIKNLKQNMLPQNKISVK